MAEIAGSNHPVVHFQREPIEVTRNGMFGGPVDTVRRFIPGPLSVWVEMHDGRRFFIPPEHHAALATSDEIGRFAETHGEPL
jgi:hypothetical protein